jgi:Ca-activated chloride channel family protein
MNRPHILPAIATLLMLLTATPSTLAQGVLVDIRVDQPIRLPRPIVLHRHIPQPPPTSSYKIKSLEVNAKLTDQIARVQVAQTFENTGSVPMEVCFMFPLPYDGAIDRLTLLVDGKNMRRSC